MKLNSMAGLWARTALIWFVVTISFGMYMGMTQQFGLSSPHAHMGLLGWVSSALFAFLYSVAPAEAEGRGPVLHWAGHNLGVATMVVGLYLTMSGNDMAGMIAAGGAAVVLATFWLAITMWPRLGRR